jgi:tryptophan-rich sensory protein
MNKKTQQKALSLAGFVLPILTLSGLVGWLTSENIDTWYNMLHKPGFTPPNWVFGPTWTALYIMIALSGWRVYQQQKLNGKTLLIYVLQLILNFSWSVIFFTAHNMGWALVDITLLWLLILLNIVVFYRHSKTAAYWLIPYFLWVGFASILNLGFWLTN